MSRLIDFANRGFRLDDISSDYEGVEIEDVLEDDIDDEDDEEEDDEE